MEENRHLISDAAKMLGIEPHVLRYWEEELELNIQRNDMGHRYYTDADLRALKRVHELKEQGFQLKALKKIIPRLYADKDLNLNQMLGQGEGTDREENEADSARMEEKLNQKVIGLDSVRPPSTTYVKIKPADHKRKSQGSSLTNNISKANSLSYGKVSGNTIEKKVSEKQDEKNGDINIEEDMEMGKSIKSNTAVAEQKPQDILSNEHKLAQFQEIMNLAVSKALSEQQHALGEAVGARMSEEVSERVSDKVLKQMDYLMRESDDHAEERYKKLDETIREVQKARMEAAASSGVGKRKGLFRKRDKKNNKMQ